jgi:2-methylcitrate dehydratase PrpD
LLEGDCFVNQFTEDMVADPERMRIADKVQVRHDTEITARGSKFRHMVRVECELNDGTHMQQVVEAGRGNEKDFASEADVVEKFHKLAARALDRSQAEQVVDWFMNLEKSTDASALPRLLTPR